VSFVSVAEQLDLTSPMGWAMFQVQGVFAEFYSRNLSVETAKGKREKAQQGGWVGPLPIGYQKDERGELVPSADAVIVQTIFELYATRQHSFTSLADELNSRGYQTNDWQTGKRGRFGRESVRTILSNHAYLGVVSAAGVAYQGRHTPLISTNLWEAVQTVRSERVHDHGSPVRSSKGWLLGAVYCTACGGKYWHHFGSLEGRARYYRCGGISRRECTAPQARADTLEAQMLDILSQLIIPDTARAALIAELHRLAQHELPPQGADNTRAITARLQQLKDAYNADILTRVEYEKKCQALHAQQRSRPVLPLNIQNALERLNDMPRLLRDVEPYERLSLVRALFEKIWIEKRNIVRLTPRADVGELIAGLAHVSDGVPDGFQVLRIESTSPFDVYYPLIHYAA